ncbi:hypothetical protein [Aeromonas diversa]|nr:hypothetical protein [Aeromonas diversa]
MIINKKISHNELLTRVKEIVPERSVTLLLAKVFSMLRQRGGAFVQLCGDEKACRAALLSGMFDGVLAERDPWMINSSPLTLWIHDEDNQKVSINIERLYQQIFWVFHEQELIGTSGHECLVGYRENLFHGMDSTVRHFCDFDWHVNKFIPCLARLLKLFHQEPDRKLILFGTGAGSMHLDKSALFDGVQYGWSDNNVALHNSMISGLPVIPPLHLVPGEHFVLIMSSWYKEISEQLIQMGFVEGDDFISGLSLYYSLTLFF